MSDNQPARQVEQIADRVIDDPATPPDVNVIVGWLGQSDRRNILRIYRRLDFSEYVEVSESDVIHIEGTDEGLRASLLWIKATGQLRVYRPDVDVARAWKDRGYREGLTVEQLMAVPPHPSGTVEMPNVLLGAAVAGSPLVCTPASTFAWTCCDVKKFAAAP